MDDLKRIEGKSIKSFKTNRSDKSTTLIIQFTEGGKINIVGYPNGEAGTAQLDIMVDKIKIDDIIGKRIDVVVEEYNGDNEYLIIKLRGGGSLIISAYCSSEDETASLKTTVYSSDEIVKESKIKNEIMKKEVGKIKFVAESLQEAIDMEMEHPMDRKRREKKFAFDTEAEGPYYDPADSREDLAAVGMRGEDGRNRYRPDTFEDEDDEIYQRIQAEKAAHQAGVDARREARIARRGY